MVEERLKLAVFIDFDNVQIGVKDTLGKDFDVSVVLEALKERGEVVTKLAYGDWPRAGEQSRQMTQHAVQMVQRNLTPRGDKNGADINLALDALEMAFNRAAHQCVRHRGRRQRFHRPGREAEAIRQAGLRGRRPRVYQQHPAAELSRVHQLRESAQGRGGFARPARRRERSAVPPPTAARWPRRFPMCSACSRSWPNARSRPSWAC